jgi:hypothetical protein
VAPLAVPELTAGRALSPHDVAALAQADAVRLFVARAQAAQLGFVLTIANAEAVATICRYLDGLPLAIELAAVRLRVLSVAALLAGLEHRLRLLTGGPRDAPDRLRAMSNAIAWSYDLLSEDERSLFRRLGVFVGGFTLEGAEWVLGYGLQVMDTASRVDASPQPATRNPQPSTTSPPWWIRACCSGSPTQMDSRATGCSRRSGRTRWTNWPHVARRRRSASGTPPGA